MTEEANESNCKLVVKTVFLQNYTKRQLDYIPEEHRQMEHSTTYFETLAHMLKACIGTGILAMPHAFYKSGYVVGVLGTLLIGALCIYSIRTLIHAEYELCKRNLKPCLTYNGTAYSAMKEGPECCRNFQAINPISNALIIAFQLGCGCIYLLFVSTNLREMTEYFVGNSFQLIYFMVVDAFLLCVLATISNLKFLAKVSLSANITMTLSFIILGVYIFKDGITFEDRQMVGNPVNFPLFIGTVLFSLEAIGAMIPLENEMKEPTSFISICGVLNVAMVPTVILYFCVGLFGYLRFGEDIKGSITLNLPHDEAMSFLCKILFIYGILCTNVLNVFISFEIIWDSYLLKEDESTIYSPRMLWVWKYSLRVALIVVMFLFAVLIPNLELFISLIGSLCLASAGIAFPALFSLYTYWEDYSGVSFVLFFLWCAFIMFIGILACFVGVMVTFENIYVDLWKKL